MQHMEHRKVGNMRDRRNVRLGDPKSVLWGQQRLYRSPLPRPVKEDERDTSGGGIFICYC